MLILPNKPLILFLDLDGPVIDLHMYNTEPYQSYLRLGCNPYAVKNIVKLCKRHNLTIVTNSRHNYYEIAGRTLQHDLISWGVPANLFHDDWRTSLTEVPYRVSRTDAERCADRMNAINQWISEHPQYDWICFDDRKFTDNHRLIHIQRSAGVDDMYYEQAESVIAQLHRDEFLT